MKKSISLLFKIDCILCACILYFLIKLIVKLEIIFIGEYALEFYGNVEERDGDRHWHLCQFLLVYGKANFQDGDKSESESTSVNWLADQPAAKFSQGPPDPYTPDYFKIVCSL